MTMKALILKLRGALAPRSLKTRWRPTQQHRRDERCQCFKSGEQVKASQEPEVITIVERERKEGATINRTLEWLMAESTSGTT